MAYKTWIIGGCQVSLCAVAACIKFSWEGFNVP